MSGDQIAEFERAVDQLESQVAAEGAEPAAQAQLASDIATLAADAAAALETAARIAARDDVAQSSLL